MEWLRNAPYDMFTVDLCHEYFSTDDHEWPTPVRAFIRSASWLPADDPSRSGPVRRYFRPNQIWVSNDRFPYFLRQVAVSVGKIIDRHQPEVIQKLMMNAGLRLLNDPSTVVEQACFLAEQYEAGGVRLHYEPQLVNLYNATWKIIGDRHTTEPQSVGPATPDMRLIVRRSGRLGVVTPSKEPAPIYVRDADDEVAPSLVSSLDDGWLLDIKGADRKKIGLAVEALFGTKVTRLSTMRYDVKIDGVVLHDVDSDAPVLELCPWLRVMLAISMEGLRGADAAQLPTDRGVVLAKLEQVSYLAADEISFEINEHSITAPGDRPAYVFRRPNGQSLIVMPHKGAMT